MSDKLLSDIKGSISDMQTHMQQTYEKLADHILSGESQDKSVRITMSATYQFDDIQFDEKALQGGVKEFKNRIKEAWGNLCEKIQQTTQAQTVELLQNMQIPDEIKNISSDDDEGEGGSTGGTADGSATGTTGAIEQK